jgi:hypothetical protein
MRRTRSWGPERGLVEEGQRNYVLVDKSLRVKSKRIFRKGISLRCTTAGARHATVGQVGTEASDHCPVMVRVEVGDTEPRA